ncbi:MAG: hypothetical protein GY703_10090 [Gammaproteobacteria bacterium]|nr:hypothetical protein [Gammaproteobacteria bacterium]
MPWELSYDPETCIVTCRFSGHATANDFKEGTLKMVSFRKQHGTYLVLVDNSELEATVSTVDIYEMPRFYDEINLI